ncbi:MAG: hypothetical protein GEU93_00010 [Propionibacteriales bacterium]|nr:hypothetical protein [Propionibacteriales bacterium]
MTQGFSFVGEELGGEYGGLGRGEYIEPLYTDPIGWVLVAGATVSLLIGVFVMRKVIRVDV